jgi:hypothetical protein
MDESTSPENGRAHDPKARGEMRGQPAADSLRPDGQAPVGAANPSAPAVLETTPRDPHHGRVRRILPWVIAAVAVLVAAIAIGVLIVNESSEPRPVAQLTPQADPDQGAIPLDDETAANFGVTEADFVSYGSYGELQVWSMTTPEAKRCLAMAAENAIIMVRCAAPTLDPVADLDLPSEMLPPAPSGEPTFNIRFILRDQIVDVYLAPNPEGGFY